MKKLIIEIDEQCYEQVINDPEWDTLSDVLAFAIYFEEVLKEAKPLQTEFEEIKADVDNLTPLELIHKARILSLLDNRISKLKGEQE